MENDLLIFCVTGTVESNIWLPEAYPKDKPQNKTFFFHVKDILKIITGLFVQLVLEVAW